MNLKDKNYVSGLKSNMHVLFDSPQGREVMEFLEQSCCWYESVLTPNNPDLTLINAGKREVLATIKTILKLSPEQIVTLVENKED